MMTIGSCAMNFHIKRDTTRSELRQEFTSPGDGL